MKIVITGCPGTGKSSIAKFLSTALKVNAINEKEFALKKGIAELEDEEVVIDAQKLKKELNLYITSVSDVILEGHILCEISLNVEKVFVLRAFPELIELRLSQRKKYSEEKIQDNVFCEGIDYCKKLALKKYKKEKVIEVDSSHSIEKTAIAILNHLGHKI